MLWSGASLRMGCGFLPLFSLLWEGGGRRGLLTLCSWEVMVLRVPFVLAYNLFSKKKDIEINNIYIYIYIYT